MLPNHTPLKVAESFRVLHALFPGRIDLGLGRAPGTDPRTAAALRRSREAVKADDFPEQLAELARYLEPDGPPRPGFATTIRAIPTNVPSPELWLLGSGDSGGAALAAERGLGFAFAHYMNPDEAAPVLRRYRETFVPSPGLAKPWAILAIGVICAESDEAAERLSTSSELAMVWFRQGTRIDGIDMPWDAPAHLRPQTEEKNETDHSSRLSRPRILRR